MTFEEKVSLYLERAAQGLDGDTEALGAEIVHQLAQEHAQRKNKQYRKLILREPGRVAASSILPIGESSEWSLLRLEGALVFQNEQGTIVPFHAVKLAVT